MNRSLVDDRLDSETTFESPLTAAQRAALVRDLCAHAVPLRTVHAGNGFDDLTALDRLIGDARIVALGEATHGTAEFFQMKHRLVEYLVEKKGFTVFAIEGNWPEAQVADRLIKTGEGDAATALAAMYYWTWQTQEVAGLLHWMRQYNATRGERAILSFAGFDMQVPKVAINRVIDCLDRIGSAAREATRELYGGMEKLDKWGTGTPPEENRRLAGRASMALDLIEGQREALVQALTPEEYRDIRQAARIVLQVFERRAGIIDRDRAMAENVRWLVEEAFPGQKIVVWAHNSHIGTDIGCDQKNLGNHLRDRYGDQMVTIGFATHHGAVRARRSVEEGTKPGPLGAMPLAPASGSSVEALFQELGMPRFILDLRGLPKDGAASAWLAETRSHRIIGAVYDPEEDAQYYAQMRLSEMYDSIVFISESTAAKPLK